MRLLLTGRGGQVGGELLQALASLGAVVAPERAQLDLGQPGRLAAAVRDVAPQVIVNAAAYTNVDGAEKERELAFRVNAAAPGELAEAARKSGALLVHYSTDYVFDGAKAAAYVETDAVAPLNAYGASKLEGERAIAASGCRHLILRTSWVYGPRGRNFLLSMLRLGRERAELRVVDDQVGAPTSSRAIARATAEILRAHPDGGAGGLCHLSASGKVSWCGFARAIFERAGLATPVVPIRSEEYPSPARRPRNSVLDNSRLRAAFGVALAPWQDGLDEVMKAL